MASTYPVSSYTTRTGTEVSARPLPAGRRALAAGRADACWVPIARGLTLHGLGHTYKTLMVELGTPATLMDAQMGHADGPVQARYTHITPAMSERLLDGLTALWRSALAVRRDLSSGSPVAVFDRLFRERAQ